jgi:NAD(P)H-dependent flavin oxidoreductase YrpB (nitropropane dioxygenase family)
VFQTRITQMLGIAYPLVGGAMMWISKPEFIASISNAGGLGILASAMYPTRKQFETAIEKTLDLTDKPFAINLNLFPMRRPVDNLEYFDVMVEKNLRFVETSGHTAPETLCRRFKDAGMIWMHKCVGLRYAKKAQELGADIVTVVGYENGGATGKLDIGTMVLVPRAAEVLRIPVIGGGGVSDARSFLAVLALGGQGVIMGTRLLATKEAPLHERLKRALIEATENDTMLILRSIGATHRVWANAAAKKCIELESVHADPEEILTVVAGEKARLMYENGGLDEGIISCGQGIGLVHDIPTVKELFERIIGGASKIVKGFQEQAGKLG